MIGVGGGDDDQVSQDNDNTADAGNRLNFDQDVGHEHLLRLRPSPPPSRPSQSLRPLP